MFPNRSPNGFSPVFCYPIYSSSCVAIVSSYVSRCVSFGLCCFAAVSSLAIFFRVSMLHALLLVFGWMVDCVARVRVCVFASVLY